GDRAPRRALVGRGVVNENIKGGALGEFSAEALDRGGIAEIKDRRVDRDVVTGAAGLLPGTAEGVVEVARTRVPGENEVEAVARQLDGDGPSHAPRGAGNHRDTAAALLSVAGHHHRAPAPGPGVRRGDRPR